MPFPRSRRTALAALLGSLAAFPASAGALGPEAPGGPSAGVDHGALGAEEDFDARTFEALRPEPPPPTAGAARADLRRSLGRLGVVEVDSATGAPRFIGRLDGFLTGPSDADPAAIALGFLRENLAAVGLDTGDLSSLEPAGRHTDVWGTTHLAWAQELGGVPAFESGLKAAVDERGRLINITGTPQPDLEVRSLRPKLGASAALAVAQRSGGESVALPPVAEREGGPERTTEFADGSAAGLVLFPAGEGDVDLSWRVINVESSTEIYDTVVDASTGTVLRRENLVDFASGTVWEYFPHANTQVLPAQGGDGGGGRANRAFPDSWGTSSSRLFGNFAHVYTDVDDDANAPPGYADSGSPEGCGAGAQECGEIAPTSGSDWNYPFTGNPGGIAGTNCGLVFPMCSWDPSDPFSWNVNVGQNGTQVYYFVNTFRDWLAAAPFGFAGSEGFEGTDRVNAQILDGAALASGLPRGTHVNNANMATFPGVDTPPRMQMYLFTELGSGSAPDVNGGDDASVVYHEYAHGLSNRLVTSSPGQPALSSFQSDAMGEGWSDWYAMDYLEANDLDEDDRDAPGDDGEMNVGYYTFGGDVHTLRTMGLDCAVGSSDPDCDNPSPNQAGAGGYTYGDMGRILCDSGGGDCRPEVHADGEIWGQTLWDLRQALRSDTTVPFDDPHDAGLDQARAIITQGMRLSPPNPSFLEMRNAILQANQSLFGGSQSSLIWSVFAARGMGFFASGLGGNDLSPVQSFSAPPSCASGCGTVSGRVVESESGQPVAGATVEFLGPGNLVGTTDGAGNYSIRNVPAHTYPYVASSAPGHEGELRTGVSVGAAGATLDMQVTRDWAAISGGAAVTGFTPPDFSDSGCGPGGAFDLSLVTGWGSSSPGSNSFEGGEKAVTVRLPRRVEVTAFAIDPGATCGDDDSASLGEFEVLTSADGSGFATAVRGVFDSDDNHRLNVVRPSRLTPGIRFIRFVMKSTQPGTTGASGVEFMDVSEVEVWGRAAGTCGGRAATRTGTVATDRITGTPRRDVIVAGAGNDVVKGLGGNDLICSGAGGDTIIGGGGRDDARGGAGRDRLRGASGRDRLIGGAAADRLSGGAGVDRLTGGTGRDTCAGDGGRDFARGCERRRTL